MTDGDLITACPECDSPAIKPRNPGKPSSPPSHTTNWYCNDCGAQFDEPAERPRHSEAGGRAGLAGKLARADSVDDLRADGGQAWRPVAGDYAPERGAWLVLYARYGPDGWEYSQRVEEPDGTMLRSERGAVAEDEPDLRTDGGRTVADVLAECDARDRIEPLEAVLRGDRDHETLTIEDWTRPVKVTSGALCLAFDTDQQTIHIGYDGEAFRFTSEIYREGYGGSRPVDDVAEVRALVSRYDPEVVLREATPFAWGSSRTWDGEDCPHKDCDGDLQQQGDANVMCLSCEDVWGHHKNDEEHYLVSKGSNIATRKPRVETDGGEDLEHYCEICEQPFETVAALIKHDCDDPNEDAPLVTDGGARIDWPPEFERTEHRRRTSGSKFQASLADTTKELAAEMDRMGVDDWRASTGSGGRYVKSNGLPKHNANPDDPGFVLRWSDDGEQFAVGCDKYRRLRDNCRAVYLWVHETRMREQRPVVTGDTGFAAARLPSGEEGAIAADPPAHEVLDVAPDAPEAIVEGAYRAKVQEVHPDKGGSQEAFERVQQAREAMLDE